MIVKTLRRTWTFRVTYPHSRRRTSPTTRGELEPPHRKTRGKTTHDSRCNGRPPRSSNLKKQRHQLAHLLRCKLKTAATGQGRNERVGKASADLGISVQPVAGATFASSSTQSQCLQITRKAPVRSWQSCSDRHHSRLIQQLLTHRRRLHPLSLGQRR